MHIPQRHTAAAPAVPVRRFVPTTVEPARWEPGNEVDGSPLPVMWDHTLGHWPVIAGCGSMSRMTAAVIRRFVARRHVDYGRVRSAICPAN
ncbi:hypothetical protein [Micromonospora chersina]